VTAVARTTMAFIFDCRLCRAKLSAFYFSLQNTKKGLVKSVTCSAIRGVFLKTIITGYLTIKRLPFEGELSDDNRD
jgi:hypothetical protein